MATLTLRNTKGSELTFTEVDNNFTALNTTVSSTITAAGSTQGTATALVSTVTFITSAASGTGVILPAPDDAERLTIVNHGANPVNIYPASGHTIDNGTTNAPLVLAQGCAVDVIGTTTTNWTGVTFDIWDDENAVIVFPAHASTPPPPPAGYISIFAKSQANRPMPAFIGPSGLDTVLQPHMAKNGWAQWKPGTGTTISAIGAAALTATGTATAANYATTSLHTRCARVDYLVTTAATTAVAGFRIATNAYRRTDGFQMIFRVAPATGTTGLATRRFFCGMSTSTAAPTDVDPGTLTNTCGVGYAAGTDTNWQIYFGGASVAKVNSGIAIPTTDRDGPFTVIVFCPPGGAYIGVRITNEVTGASFETTTSVSTNMLAATTACGPRGYHSVGGTSSVVGFTLFSGYMETDN